MRGIRLLLITGTTVLTLHSCNRTEHSFNGIVQCYTDYDDIELTLTNVATKESSELSVQADGTVQFDELPDDQYTLRTVVDPGLFPYPSFESTHHFVPSVHLPNLLDIPSTVEVIDIEIEFEDGEASISGRFITSQCFDADSIYAYGASDWPFDLSSDHLLSASGGGFEAEFTLPIQDSTFHIVFEFVSNRNGRRAVTRSRPITSSMADVKYQKVEFGIRYDFHVGSGENFVFEADLIKGQLYLIEFWDAHNSTEYSGEELVVALDGILSDVRTKLVSGAAIPLYGWRDDPLLITCSAAAFTSPGTYALRITELSDLPVENLKNADTVMFTSNTEVRIFRGSYQGGQQYFHYDRLQNGADGRVKFSLFRSMDWQFLKTAGDRPILNDGPAYPNDQKFTRGFKLAVPMDVYLVLTSTYDGDPGGVTISVD
ncbi:MAG: hypothetical protein RIF46_01470 [Cyclobacteriaceae bacterium]